MDYIKRFSEWSQHESATQSTPFLTFFGKCWHAKVPKKDSLLNFGGQEFQGDLRVYPRSHQEWRGRWSASNRGMPWSGDGWTRVGVIFFGAKGWKAMMTWWVAGKMVMVEVFLWFSMIFYDFLYLHFDVTIWESSSHCFLKIVPPSVQLKCKFRWKEMAVVQIFSNKGPWWLPRERLSCLPLHPRSLTQICSPFSTICGIFEERYWTLSLFRWETNT